MFYLPYDLSLRQPFHKLVLSRPERLQGWIPQFPSGCLDTEICYWSQLGLTFNWLLLLLERRAHRLHLGMIEEDKTKISISVERAKWKYVFRLFLVWPPPSHSIEEGYFLTSVRGTNTQPWTEERVDTEWMTHSTGEHSSQADMRVHWQQREQAAGSRPCWHKRCRVILGSYEGMWRSCLTFLWHSGRIH